MSEAGPIAFLRQVADAAERGEPVPSEAGRWFATQFREYEALAPSGMTLDKAMGVGSAPGAGPWWLQDARVRRDEALRELHRACFAGQPPIEAAKQITRLAVRRRHANNPPVGTHERLVDTALRSGARFPKAKRLAVILGISVGQ